MNIVFIGMQGSGKTAVARSLAKRLKRKFVDTDQIIVENQNMSITDIVTNHGWKYFRQLERAVIKDISKQNMPIIATGGGVVENQKNIETLKKNRVIFYLKTQLNTLIKRINNHEGRPRISNKKTFLEDMAVILKRRQQLYEKAADEIIITDNLTINEVAKIVLEKIKKV